jgi:small subunit ribosomal protein S16
MLRIRFFRKGRKKQPFYKIVVTDKNNPPSSGRFVEEVGFYNPHTKECKIEGERVIYWMDKGAQPSDVVHNLLIKNEIIKGEKKNVVSLTKKRQAKIEEEKKNHNPK